MTDAAAEVQWAAACREACEQFRRGAAQAAAAMLPAMRAAADQVRTALAKFSASLPVPAMSEESAFLASIIANPADDVARLVYADWLQEHGREDRAELIRVQVELRRQDSGTLVDWATHFGRRKELQEREARLLDGPRPDLFLKRVVWFNAGDGTGTWNILFRPEWGRGFVEAVTCAGGHWVEHGDAIRAAHPVERVRLLSWPDMHADAKDGDSPWACYLAGRTRRHFVPAWDAAAMAPSGTTEGSRDVIASLLDLEWPGVAFELPRSHLAGGNVDAVTRSYSVTAADAQGAIDNAPVAVGDRDDLFLDMVVTRLDAAHVTADLWSVTATYERRRPREFRPTRPIVFPPPPGRR